MGEEYLTIEQAKDVFITQKDFNLSQEAVLSLVNEKVGKKNLITIIGIVVSAFVAISVLWITLINAQLVNITEKLETQGEDMIGVQTDVSWIKTTLDNYEIISE